MKSKQQVDEALGLPSAQQWMEMTGEMPEQDEDSEEMDLYQDEEDLSSNLSTPFFFHSEYMA